MRKRRNNAAAIAPGLALGLALGLGVGLGPAASQETGQETGGRLAAILQGLDKTTARVSTIEAPIGEAARFGSLQIVARACHKKPPTETPESTAFLEIVDIRPDSPAIPVFTGWMFASSPAVSAMEHPVYDVWVIDCRTIAAPEIGPETGPGAGALDLGQPQAQ